LSPGYQHRETISGFVTAISAIIGKDLTSQAVMPESSRLIDFGVSSYERGDKKRKEKERRKRHT
jgi:hypothetical protein